jgi:GNAT superfamily N-acetyltransferase
MGSSCQIRIVTGSADWKKFIDLPWQIYGDDPYWVPPLRIAVRDLLDVRKNPFFRHAIMHPLIAEKDGRCVGRIVGVIDDNHNKFHKERTAFFGFFEAIDDPEIAQALFAAVQSWAQSKGMEILRGPMNPSTNHECGLLVEGYDSSPSVMMTYNPRYYERLVDGQGFKKAKDLFAYVISNKVEFNRRLVAHAERLRQSSSVTFRPIRMRQFKSDVEMIQQIYNDAWESNWGFVPMTPEEFDHLAKDLKLIVDPEMILIVEVRGEPAGFVLTLPDVNQVFKKVKDGRLFPTGLFKLLWNLKGPGRRRTINHSRVVTLGIRKAYQPLGLGSLLYVETIQRARRRGYDTGEASWILEDNVPMNRAMEMMFGQRTKVYRIYEKSLLQ